MRRKNCDCSEFAQSPISTLEVYPKPSCEGNIEKTWKCHLHYLFVCSAMYLVLRACPTQHFS